MDAAGVYGIGVALAATSSSLSAVGLALQKRTHREIEAEKAAGSVASAGAVVATAAAPYYRRPLWLAGICCMLVGALISFGVFALLGQARASAFAALTIVWTALLSYRCLGEALTVVDLAASALILAGATVAAVYGSAGAAAQSSQDLDSVLEPLRSAASIYAALALAAGTALVAGAVQLCAGRPARSDGAKRVECLARIALAGVFSGSTGMLARDLVVAFSGAARAGGGGTLVLTRWQLYLLLASLPLSLVLQLYYLNSALRQLDALEVVPPYQACIIIVGVCWGWGFSDEGAGVALVDLSMFGLGCGVSVAGVLLLLAKRRLLSALGPRGGPLCGSGAGVDAAGVDGGCCGRRGRGPPAAGPPLGAPAVSPSPVPSPATPLLLSGEARAAPPPPPPPPPPPLAIRLRAAGRTDEPDSPRTPLVAREPAPPPAPPLLQPRRADGAAAVVTVWGGGPEGSIRRRGASTIAAPPGGTRPPLQSTPLVRAKTAPPTADGSGSAPGASGGAERDA